MPALSTGFGFSVLELQYTPSHHDVRMPAFPRLCAATVVVLVRVGRGFALPRAHLFPEDLAFPQQVIAAKRRQKRSRRHCTRILRKGRSLSGSRIDAETGRLNREMVTGNVGPVVLRAMMGHTTEAMTSRSAGVGDDAKMSALEQL